MAVFSRSNLIATGYTQDPLRAASQGHDPYDWAPHVLRGALEGNAVLSFDEDEVENLVASWLLTPEVEEDADELAGYRAVLLAPGEDPEDGDVLFRDGGRWIAQPGGDPVAIAGTLASFQTQLETMESGSAWDDADDGLVLTIDAGIPAWRTPPAPAAALALAPATSVRNTIQASANVRGLTITPNAGQNLGTEEVFRVNGRVAGATAGGMWADALGKLHVQGDASDTAGVINMYTLTEARPGGGYFRPGMEWHFGKPQALRVGALSTGPAGAHTPRWQCPAGDVTDSHGLGPGSRMDALNGPGFSNNGFGDLVLAYRIDPYDQAKSQDIIYIPDERDSRVGIHDNYPTATLDVGHRSWVGRTAGMRLNNTTAAPGWLLSLAETGSHKGGFYSAGNGFPKLAVGHGAVPTFEVDVLGTVSADIFQPRNLQSGFSGDTNYPRISSTVSGGAYPFSATGNLVLRARGSVGSATADIVLAFGQTPTPGLVLGGPSGANVPNLYLFGASPADNTTPGNSVIVAKNSTASPANAGATSRPVGSMFMWAVGSTMRFMEPAGSVVQIGNVGLASGSGIGFTAYGTHTQDAKIGRIAAGVLETDSIIRYNAAASWQTTVGAAGAASALPATPSKYLKVRDEAGTSYVVPAYAAA